MEYIQTNAVYNILSRSGERNCQYSRNRPNEHVSFKALRCMDSSHFFHGCLWLSSAFRSASARHAQTSKPCVEGSSSRNGSPFSRLRVVVLPARPRPTKHRRTTGSGATPFLCCSKESFFKRWISAFARARGVRTSSWHYTSHRIGTRRERVLQVNSSKSFLES